MLQVKEHAAVAGGERLQLRQVVRRRQADVKVEGNPRRRIPACQIIV